MIKFNRGSIMSVVTFSKIILVLLCLMGATLVFAEESATAPTVLRVIKKVVNDNGGTLTADFFNLHVKLSSIDVLGSPSPGASAPGTLYLLAPGTYKVSEDDFDAPYLMEGFSGDCDSSGTITLLEGDSKTCTITNNDTGGTIPPTKNASIDVIKIIVNDNGGTKVVSDFPLFVNGVPVISSVTNVFPANTTYTITETSDSNYTQKFSGDCDATGHLNLTAGDTMICIITNNDKLQDNGDPSTKVSPLIDVVKVPTPLALPAGPGPVTYTYTLSNIGVVPVTNVMMVGDTCSPINLASGDTNENSILDLTERWIYNCSTNLSATHTNTVTATGEANGITAIDVASATVVVGVPSLPSTGGGGGGGGGSRSGSRIVPPLIHVTKIPTPLALPVRGGMVTYTESATNPGIVPLSNVYLTDDKCGPVNYISGDTNSNSRLDTNEVWTYTCRTNLTTTTTNTVVASGEANGFTARDFAVVTVVVAAPLLPNTGIPGLPNTGYPPKERNNVWNAITIVGVFIFSISLALVLRKKYYSTEKSRNLL